jgi:hypothetical protein
MTILPKLVGMFATMYNLLRTQNSQEDGELKTNLPRLPKDDLSAHHGGNMLVEGSSVFSQQPVRRTVEQLTADRSRLVSGVPN